MLFFGLSKVIFLCEYLMFFFPEILFCVIKGYMQWIVHFLTHHRLLECTSVWSAPAFVYLRGANYRTACCESQAAAMMKSTFPLCPSFWCLEGQTWHLAVLLSFFFSCFLSILVRYSVRLWEAVYSATDIRFYFIFSVFLIIRKILRDSAWRIRL